jgi:DNA-3-methyladenine glycosylase I
MNNAGIIRNRLKINAAVTNAHAFRKVQQEFGSFDAYLWRFVNGKPVRRKRGQAMAARTPLSDELSKDLLKRGFKFVGSTICYSFMQAVGLVNDHDLTCFRYREV